jgi:hypothetical protein
MESHREIKLIAIDEQANDDVVQHGEFGKADRFALLSDGAGSPVFLALEHAKE